MSALDELIVTAARGGLGQALASGISGSLAGSLSSLAGQGMLRNFGGLSFSDPQLQKLVSQGQQQIIQQQGPPPAPAPPPTEVAPVEVSAPAAGAAPVGGAAGQVLAGAAGTGQLAGGAGSDTLAGGDQSKDSSNPVAGVDVAVKPTTNLEDLLNPSSALSTTVTGALGGAPDNSLVVEGKAPGGITPAQAILGGGAALGGVAALANLGGGGAAPATGGGGADGSTPVQGLDVVAPKPPIPTPIVPAPTVVPVTGPTSLTPLPSEPAPISGPAPNAGHPVTVPEILAGLGLGTALLGGGGGGGADAGTALKNLADANANLAGRLGDISSAGFAGDIGGRGINSIQRMVRHAQAQIRQRYSSMGMSGSTAESDDLNAAANAGVDLQFKIGNQMAQTGLTAIAALTGQSASIYTSLLNAQTSKDTALGNAIANFAGSLVK